MLENTISSHPKAPMQEIASASRRSLFQPILKMGVYKASWSIVNFILPTRRG